MGARCTLPALGSTHRRTLDSAQALADSLEAIQHTVDVGYYAPAARTTLNIVFLNEIELILTNPRVLTLWA